MGESLDRFLDELCVRRRTLAYIFVIAVTLIVIQVPYLFFVEFGTGLYVVSAINVAGFLVFAVGSGGLIRYCHRRDRADR